MTHDRISVRLPEAGDGVTGADSRQLGLSSDRVARRFAEGVVTMDQSLCWSDSDSEAIADTDGEICNLFQQKRRQETAPLSQISP